VFAAPQIGCVRGLVTWDECAHTDGKRQDLRICGGGHTMFCKGVILSDLQCRQGLGKGWIGANGQGNGKKYSRRWVMQVNMGGIRRVVL
jgi:hypothetical protein